MSLTTWSLYRLYHIIPYYTSVWRWNSCAAGFRGLILLFFMFFCLTYHTCFGVWCRSSRKASHMDFNFPEKKVGNLLQCIATDFMWLTMEDLWCTMMIHDVPIRSYRICNVWLGDAEIENQQTPKTSTTARIFAEIISKPPSLLWLCMIRFTCVWCICVEDDGDTDTTFRDFVDKCFWISSLLPFDQPFFCLKSPEVLW